MINLTKKPSLALGFIVIAGSLLGILGLGETAQAAFPAGMPSNAIPNNSYWQTPPRTQGAYLVVAHGGMEAPGMYADIYYPSTQTSVDLTIEDACDNSGIDVAGWRATTNFRFDRSFGLTDLGGNGLVTPVDPDTQSIECVSGTDLQIRLTTDTGPGRTFGGVAYRRVYFAALASNSGGLDYENQFRLSSPDGGIVISYPNYNVTGGFLGLYNRTPDVNAGSCPNTSGGRADASCYWGTAVAFAPPCSWPAGGTANVDFYDSDAQAGGYQSTRQVAYLVLRYPRDGSGGSTIVSSGNLSGPDNTINTVSGIPFDPAFAYELRMGDIFARNSLQVRLPWEQINVREVCQPPPQPPPGTIQGIKVGGGSDTDGATITYVQGGGPLAAGTTSNANPYSFPANTPSDHHIRADQVNGYRLLGFTLCVNDTSCHGNPPTPGSEVIFNLGNPGDYADLWWHYAPNPPPNMVQTCSNGNIGADISWSDAGLGEAFYVVDISANDPGFGAFWNKAVGGTSTTAPGGFADGSGNGFSFVPGVPYYMRVYYPNNNLHSTVASFTPYVCPNVQAHVFKVDSSGNYLGDMPGVTIETCGNPGITTDGSGLGYMTVAVGTAFCLRITSGPPPGTAGGPFVRPWAEGYNGCGGFGAPPWSGYCGDSTYECQTAGGYSSPDVCGFNIDRNWDGGYDFVYVIDRPPTGNVDNVTCKPSRLTGWAQDADSPGTAIQLHLFVLDGVNPVGVDFGVHPTQPNHSFDIDVSAFDDHGYHYYYVYAYGVDPAGNKNNVDVLLPNSGIRNGPCAPPTCGSIYSNPSDPEPGTPFTITASFTNNAGPRGRSINGVDHPMRLQVSGAGIVAYDNANEDYSPDPVLPGMGASATTDPPPFVSATGGNVNVTMTLSGGPVLSPGGNCTNTIRITNKPYARFYGGDMRVGCGVGSTSTLIGYNTGTGQGAGVQLAALAAQQIKDFTSATGRTSPGPPNGLSFANNAAAGTYGGLFGEVIDCPANPYEDVPGDAIELLDPVTAASFTAKKSHKYSGNLQLTLSGFAAANTALFVDGDVYINDLTYDTAAVADIKDMPHITLVAKGNVYISNTLSQVDGIIEAGGKIYTCAVPSGGILVAPTSAQIGNDCNSKLTVNGALISPQMRFFRSFGSLSKGTPAEPSASTNIAESVNYNPADWFLPAPFTTKNNCDCSIQSATSLPPIL
ncbi:MAG: hypothetical protein V4702_05010 [Patescibacteria group bacterium]